MLNMESSPLDDLDIIDLSVLLLLLQVIESEMATMKLHLLVLLRKLDYQEKQQSRARPAVSTEPRSTFVSMSSRFNDRQIRRMFRMNRDTFHDLCEKVISKIGEEAFKSDSWIVSQRLQRNADAELVLWEASCQES